MKDDLENGDSSVADILKTVSLETEVRKFIGRELREKSHNRYVVPQEEELADAKRMDFRLHGKSFDAPVPIELKLADNWSGADLHERLENQLTGDYLRDNRSNRGIFLVVYRGEQSYWVIPGGKRVQFDGLIESLERRWTELAPTTPKIEAIDVIGIDLTKRLGRLPHLNSNFA